MAVYSTSSSGNLNIANTGLTSPVSFSAFNGLASSAIASSPIAGQQSVIWLVRGIQPTTITSAGSLRLAGNLVKSQNSLAASALGEFPLGGDVDNLTYTTVVKGFVSGLIQSSGSLKLTGSSTFAEGYRRSSAGDTKLTGSTSILIKIVEKSTSTAKLTGSTAARSIFNTTSAGSLKLTGVDLDNEILRISSSGSLVTTGSNITYKRYNKFTSGSLTLTGASYSAIKLAPASSGNLRVTTKAYDPTYLGGIATNTIASNLDDLPATLRTTVTSFFGSNLSSGSLKITPYGEVVSSLSHSSGIAGSALSDNAIAAGLDTIRRASTYTTLYNISTNGFLHIQGPSTAIQYDNDTAGNMVLSGNTVPAYTRGFNTSGRLQTNGSNVVGKTLHFDSNTGNLAIKDLSGYITPLLSSSSGIAGSALAEQPIGSGIDNVKGFDFVRNLGFNSAGNLVTSGYHIVNRTLHFNTAGSLTVRGTDVSQDLEEPTSAGNLVVSGNHISVRTLHFDSRGNLYVGNSNGYTTRSLSDSSGIAGSSIASTPIGGASDFYEVYNLNRTLGFNSSGSLVTTGITKFAKRLDFLSSGNLTLIGLSGTGQQNLADSTGSLKLTGSSIGVKTLHFDSNTGNLAIKDLSGYITPLLSSSSGIAGSALAEQPIGSGIDNVKGFDFVRNLGFNSHGSLITTGNIVFSKTLDFLSAGSLKISGVDVFEDLEKLKSAGNLVVSGSSISVRTLHFDSSGNLYVGNTNGFTARSLGDSSGIAGSSIAATPIGGASDFYEVYEWNKRLGFNSQGSLLVAGTTKFAKRLDFLSSGNLTLIGLSGTGQQNLADSAGSLVLSGTNITVRTLNFATNGSTKVTSTGVAVNELTSGGTLASSSVASGSIADLGADEYRSVYVALAHGRQSAGSLKLNGYDIPNRTLDFNTSGQLRLSGSTLFARTWAERTSGSTVTAGSSYSNISWAPTSYSVLRFKDITLSTQSSIAASSLGEFPLAGTVDTISKTSVQYIKGSPSITSAGVLTFSGSISIITSRLETSAGTLVIGPADSYRVIWTEGTAGRLVLTSSRTSKNIFAPKSAGSLRISSTNAVARITVKPNSNGALTITGTNVTYKRYNISTTASLLKIITSSLAQITITERTAGQLSVVDHSIKYNNITSGASIGDNTIAAGALAGQEATNVEFIRTIVNFNSITPSAGQLKISAVGSKLVTDVSSLASSPIAGSPIAGTTSYSTKTARVTYISKGVRYPDSIFYATTSGSIKLSGLSRVGYTIGGVSVGGGTFNNTSSGRLVLTVTSTHKLSTKPTSAGSLKLTGRSQLQVKSKLTSAGQLKLQGNSVVVSNVSRTSAGSLKLYGVDSNNIKLIETTPGYVKIFGGRTSTTRATAVTSSGNLRSTGETYYSFKGIQFVESAGTMHVSGSTTAGSVFDISSHGNLNVNGSHVNKNVFSQVSTSKVDIVSNDSYQLTLNEDSNGQSSVTTESKYNITSIVSSIGSMGILGSLEEFTAIKRRTVGLLKLSGQSKVVISIKPGSRGFSIVRGETKVQTILNKEHMGGSGIYYGPWGAPFVLPFAKEYEEVNGKRRRKVSRLQVAIRFSRGDRWTRTHYNLNKMNQGIMVAASALRPTQTPTVATAPISTKPKITVNASALRLIQTRVPNVDLTNFTVVESEKVTVQDFTEKSTLVETGSIKQNNYTINATVDVDTTSFKVTVQLPKSTVDA